MSTTLHPFERNTANPFQPPPSALLIRRHISNALLIILSTFFALFAVGVLFYLILYILRQGIPYLNGVLPFDAVVEGVDLRVEIGAAHAQRSRGDVTPEGARLG